MKYAGTIIGIILIVVIVSFPEPHEHIEYECNNVRSYIVTVCVTTNSVVLGSGRHIETGRTEHIKEDLLCKKIP